MRGYSTGLTKTSSVNGKVPLNITERQYVLPKTQLKQLFFIANAPLRHFTEAIQYKYMLLSLSLFFLPEIKISISRMPEPQEAN